ALAVEEDVRRLQVAVHDPACVCVCETRGDVCRHPRRWLVRRRAAGEQPLLQRPAGQQLEHHERPAVGVAVVVERSDVRMRQRRGGARLADEALGIGGGAEHLHGHAAGELFVLGLPYRAHGAAPERLHEAIPTGDALFRHRAGLSCWRVGDLLTIGDALARVLERAQPLSAEDVPLADAAGRVAAEPAAAAIDLPPFPSSAMDGYAVRSGDTPGTLRVIVQLAAGHPASLPVVAGTSIAISTGAVVPEGADAVVPVERTDGGAEAVAVEAVAPGDNVRPRGGDVHAGDVVVTAG